GQELLDDAVLRDGVLELVVDHLHDVPVPLLEPLHGEVHDLAGRREAEVVEDAAVIADEREAALGEVLVRLPADGQDVERAALAVLDVVRADVLLGALEDVRVEGARQPTVTRDDDEEHGAHLLAWAKER